MDKKLLKKIATLLGIALIGWRVLFTGNDAALYSTYAPEAEQSMIDMLGEAVSIKVYISGEVQHPGVIRLAH